MIRTIRAALVVALAIAAMLTVAAVPSSAGTQVERYRVTARVVSGDTAWDLAVKYCGAGPRYTSLVIRSPQNQVRNLARIWPGDTATIPCSLRPATSGVGTAPATKPTTVSGWAHPLWNGARVSSCYGAPRDGGARRHHGIDMSAARGTTIRAAGAGVVISAAWRGGYGRTVEIRHTGGYSTLYAHNSALLVRLGQRVTAGQPIARMGDTGNPAPGAYHLHLEVRRYGVAVSAPGAWFRARGVRMGCP